MNHTYLGYGNDEHEDIVNFNNSFYQQEDLGYDSYWPYNQDNYIPESISIRDDADYVEVGQDVYYYVDTENNFTEDYMDAEFSKLSEENAQIVYGEFFFDSMNRQAESPRGLSYINSLPSLIPYLEKQKITRYVSSECPINMVGSSYFVLSYDDVSKLIEDLDLLIHLYLVDLDITGFFNELHRMLQFPAEEFSHFSAYDLKTIVEQIVELSDDLENKFLNHKFENDLHPEIQIFYSEEDTD